ncbi:MAG: nucleotidyltransferase [Lachnospiraceae bacterium]|nr:nucleotidyltransferase [Lachnospiraceae bacterium]MBQ6544921.1 nucleotidyltransferase [Lachnospiraceae bacterium]
MNRLYLVVMAAGMGSRYGGLKQVDPLDEAGHSMVDFSIYDAAMAGFTDVVFVIRREHESLFREMFDARLAGKIGVHYAFQELADVPEGFSAPEERKKPWGTGHAVLAARHIVDGPFAVVNADDFYGRHAFFMIRDALAEEKRDDGILHCCMAGYTLRNTLTENGSVSRGVCVTDRYGYLTGITERKTVVRRGDDAAYTLDGGATWTELPGDTVVSLNFWGFPENFFRQLSCRFPAFLAGEAAKDPLKAEFLLPEVVAACIREGIADVSVRTSPDSWYGVTYREDRDKVSAAIARMQQEGLYPKEF